MRYWENKTTQTFISKFVFLYNMETTNNKQTRTERIRNISKPYVMKNKNGQLYIIYKNRIEIFKSESTHTKKEIDKENPDCSFDYEEIYGNGWNKEHEHTMLENNGFENVGLKDE